ncbi:cyanophycinase [Arsukibacterium perlucidum]|uniref:cyanophycinase n=1 Tax=Arsukibacterium perlucidum TaxID=368811 RepID=UPI00035C6383|nr:cyanophycinase [Arsukibacterium perlucidum]
MKLCLLLLVLLLSGCSQQGLEADTKTALDVIANAEQCGFGPRPIKPVSLQRFAVGYNEDVCVPLSPEQAGIILMGGSTDVDSIFTDKVRPYIQGGNVLVLRTQGAAGYNDYLLNLLQAASVETLLVDSRDKANSDYVSWALRSAEFIWFAGGDQSTYIANWQDTALQQALHAAYQRGAIIGGTSAGNAILSSIIYNPDGVGSAVSSEVVQDFCDTNIAFSPDFLKAPMLGNTLSDTHFKQRDRMGRLMVFLAHHQQQQITGIGVSERTALWVERSGNTEVFGEHEVYLLRADQQTNFRQTECGKPVIIDDLLYYKLQKGHSYHLLDHTSAVPASRISINGNNENFYTPANPY